MKKEKRTFTIQVPNAVLKTLDKYGFDYERNIQQLLEDTAYWIWVEENDADCTDVGTETANEVKRQNGEN